MRADRNVELILLVAGVRFVLAEIEADAGTAEIRAGETVGDRVRLRDHPDVDRPVHEDLVARQQPENLVEDGQKLIAKGVDVVRPALGHVALETADAGIARGEARAGEFLEQFVEFLALGETIHKHRPGARIDAEGAEAHEVRGDARELGGDDADRLTARRHLEFGEALDRDGVGHVVRERGEVVQPVRVGHELVVGHVLRDLLVAAVQVADDRVALRQDLAVEFHLQAEHAVGRRMRRAHRERHLFGLELRRRARGFGGAVGKSEFGGHRW
jgi:hypothetical protein